jgi:hypothetical protein
MVASDSPQRFSAPAAGSVGKRKANHAVRRPTSLVWRSLVGITSKSTHSSKQRPAAVRHLVSRSPAQLQRSLRPALKRAAAVNTRQSRAGPRRCDRVHQHPHLCDRHRPTFFKTRYCVDLTASPVMRRLRAGTVAGMLASPRTCRCIAAASRCARMFTERREVAKESV